MRFLRRVTKLLSQSKYRPDRLLSKYLFSYQNLIINLTSQNIPGLLGNPKVHYSLEQNPLITGLCHSFKRRALVWQSFVTRKDEIKFISKSDLSTYVIYVKPHDSKWWTVQNAGKKRLNLNRALTVYKTRTVGSQPPAIKNTELSQTHGKNTAAIIIFICIPPVSNLEDQARGVS